MTTTRAYKPAFTHGEAMQILEDEARRGWRDPELVPLFAQLPHPLMACEPAGETAVMRESLENMRRQLER